MHFISGRSLLDVPYTVRVEYYQDPPKAPQCNHETKEGSIRYFEGT